MPENTTQPISESFVQQLWAEEIFQNPLVTLAGEKIQILQSGFRNHQAGPDFLHACIVNEKGIPETGAVEIHLEPQSWDMHGHRLDPRYENVILHVVWDCGTKEYFSRTSENRYVRQVELKNQLPWPLASLRTIFHNTPECEETSSIREGECASWIGAWEDARVLEILENAGHYRFRKKTSLWQMRANVWGAEQALWTGIAEALGYSANKEAFRALAQRVKIADLLNISLQGQREALLLGMAGFLPDKILPRDHQHVRRLWDFWWKERSEKEIFILPKNIWRFTGVRPQNRPEKRIAALSLLSERRAWNALLQKIEKGDTKNIRDQLLAFSHPFWNHRFSFRSSVQSSKSGLIGDERIQAMLFNIVLPFCNRAALNDEMLKKLAPAPYSQKLRFISKRLLGKRRIALTRLAQEGLLQIHENICAHYHHQCAQCDFLKNDAHAI
ncbi:MAG: DUF2851 family protein [Verrucomicrobiota bacterium]